MLDVIGDRRVAAPFSRPIRLTLLGAILNPSAILRIEASPCFSALMTATSVCASMRGRPNTFPLGTGAGGHGREICGWPGMEAGFQNRSVRRFKRHLADPSQWVP
jgi:hypothetical protein